jgi:N-acetyltransferase 10
LLAGSFRNFNAALCLTILDPRIRFPDADEDTKMEALRHVLRPDGQPLSPYDMKRLQAYSSNLVDHHLILDLMPSISRAYFCGHIPATLSYSQAAILLIIGLQCKSIDDVAQDLGLPSTQVLALFSKSIRKLHSHLKSGKEAQIARKLPARKDLKATASLLRPHAVGVDEDLEDGAAEIQNALDEDIKAYKSDMLSEKELGDLEQYAINGSAADVVAAASGAQLTSGGLISVKVDDKSSGKGGKKHKESKGKKREDTPKSDRKKKRQKT